MKRESTLFNIAAIRFAGALVLWSALTACSSPSQDPKAPIEKRISMPEDPVADARARVAISVNTQILAERIELYLPPGLYGDVEFITQNHVKDEFETAAGLRITLRPPEKPLPNNPPARVNIGHWRLAARGKVDVLFALPGDGPAARIQAFGVDLLHRNGESRRGLPQVDIDDGAVKTPGSR